MEGEENESAEDPAYETGSSCTRCIYQQKMYQLPTVFGVSAMLLFSAYHYNQLFTQQESYHVDYDRQRIISLISLVSETTAAVFACTISVIIISRLPLTVCLLLSVLTFIAHLLTAHLPILWLNIITALFFGAGKNLQMVIASSKIANVGQNLNGLTCTKAKIIHQKLFAIFYGLYQLSYVISSLINLTQPSPTDPGQHGLYTNDTSHGEMLSGREYCVGSPSCIHLIPANFSKLVTSTQIDNVVLNITNISLLAVYIFCGLIAAILLALANRTIDAVTNDDLTTLACFTLIKDWKFGFVVPFMAFSGLIEGFLFLDYIMVNTHCYSYASHKVFVLLSYGLTGCLVSVCLITISPYLNRVHRMTISCLIQISVIILLIAAPPRIQHPAIFYISVSLISVCITLWRTQLSVLVAVLEPKRKIQAYSTLYIFHCLGYLMAGCMSTYLCMNTKLYILLASAILAQFLYLMNELKLRILKISQQRGGTVKRQVLQQPQNHIGSNGGSNSVPSASSISARISHPNKHYKMNCRNDDQRPSLEPMLEITSPAESEALSASEHNHTPM